MIHPALISKKTGSIQIRKIAHLHIAAASNFQYRGKPSDLVESGHSRTEAVKKLQKKVDSAIVETFDKMKAARKEISKLKKELSISKIDVENLKRISTKVKKYSEKVSKQEIESKRHELWLQKLKSYSKS